MDPTTADFPGSFPDPEEVQSNKKVAGCADITENPVYFLRSHPLNLIPSQPQIVPHVPQPDLPVQSPTFIH